MVLVSNVVGMFPHYYNSEHTIVFHAMDWSLGFMTLTLNFWRASRCGPGIVATDGERQPFSGLGWNMY